MNKRDYEINEVYMENKSGIKFTFHPAFVYCLKLLDDRWNL